MGCFAISKDLEDILSKELRITFYVTVAQIMGTLVGIVIAGLTILLTMEKSTSMKILKKSPFYNELFGIFIICIKKLAISTGICIVLLIVDSANIPKLYCFYIVTYFCVNCSVSLWRCIWVLQNVVRLQI